MSIARSTARLRSSQTNVVGTFTLLEAARQYHATLQSRAARGVPLPPHLDRRGVRRAGHRRSAVRRDHPLRSAQPLFGEQGGVRSSGARLVPHLSDCRRIVSNTGNNYGPWQFPEKLIPLVTLNALEGKPLPVYGDGSNRRDWIFVEDHAAALVRVLEQGEPGATYAIGARQPRSNLDVVRAICAELDRRLPDPAGPRERLIHFVTDRPGPRFPLRDRPVARRGGAGLDRAARLRGRAGAHHRLVSGAPRLVAGGARRRYAGQRLGTAA